MTYNQLKAMEFIAAKGGQRPSAIAEHLGLNHNLALHNIMNPLFKSCLVFKKWVPIPIHSSKKVARKYTWELTYDGMEVLSQRRKIYSTYGKFDHDA